MIRTMIIRIFILLVIVLITACAAMGPVYVDAPLPKDNDALVYIYRPSNSIWSGRDSYFYVNDINIVDLSANGYTWFHIPAGNYVLKQKWPIDINLGLHDIVIPVEWSSHQKVYYRLESKMDNPDYFKIIQRWQWRVSEVSEAQALEEIRNCHLQSPFGLGKLTERINYK